jgi:hypothetical protein
VQTEKKLKRKKQRFEIQAPANLAEEDLVGVRAVDVGGVEEGDPRCDGVVDELDHVGLGLGRAVEGGHAHASEALRGDLQALRAELHAGNGHGSGSHDSSRQQLEGARRCSPVVGAAARQ